MLGGVWLVIISGKNHSSSPSSTPTLTPSKPSSEISRPEPDAEAPTGLVNGLERLNKEIKRRTRVATLFPNSASCLRLVSAILAEHDEEWVTARIYLTMRP